MSKGFFGGGNGTVNSPFLIEDADDLNAMRFHPDKCFKMVNDVNLGNGVYNVGQGWNPIQNFTGQFDGNFHKIINLTINRPSMNSVGFFQDTIGVIVNRVSFVDANVIGHDEVAILSGYNTADVRTGFSSSTLDPKNNINNIYIINSKVTGNSTVSGLVATNDSNCGYETFYNIYIDAEIKSNDSIAYGITHINNFANYDGRSQDNDITTSQYINKFNGKRNCNCYCHCHFNCNCGYDCHCSRNGNDASSNLFYNCVVKLHKNPSIITYYGIAQTTNQYIDYSTENCYVDNTEVSPIIKSGTQYADLSKVKYSVDILPVLSKQYFTFEPTKTVKPKNLNLDSIYFQLTDGYYVYDFSNKKFVKKYTELTNANSKKIIQNGMNRFDLQRIPSKAIKFLKDNYKDKKIKVIDCIIAHEKLIFNTLNYKGQYIKSENNKNFVKTKIKFKDVNDQIVVLKSIS